MTPVLSDRIDAGRQLAARLVGRFATPPVVLAGDCLPPYWHDMRQEFSSSQAVIIYNHKRDESLQCEK